MGARYLAGGRHLAPDVEFEFDEFEFKFEFEFEFLGFDRECKSPALNRTRNTEIPNTGAYLMHP